MSDSDSEEGQYSDFWISKFLRNKENLFLERIPDSFLLDKFNFHNLRESVDDFRDCYLALLDQGPSYNFPEESKLYFLLHRRYIMFNSQGFEGILDKIKSKVFGVCPRYGCKEEPLIPVGLHNDFGKSKTKVFCNSCLCLYEPRGHLRKLDGCVWGTTYCPFVLLLKKYEFKRKNNKKYNLRLFGFDVELDETLSVSSDE